MKKRLLGLLIAATMVICAIPMTASAEEKAVKIGDTPLVSGQEYNSSSTIEKAKITSGSVKLVDNTLYLNSATIEEKDGETPSSWDMLSSQLDSLTIVLTGANTINDANINCESCISGKNITIKGTGSLTLKGNSGTFGCTGTLTFDSAQVTAYRIWTEKGSYDKGVMNFNGTSVVNVTTSEEHAIQSEDEIFFNLTEGGKVHAASTETAIVAYSYDTIELGTNNVITLPTNGKIASIDKEGQNQYIADAEGNGAEEATVEYVASAVKPAGANTGDSNNIALFSILGILALCGAGFACKRREN